MELVAPLPCNGPARTTALIACYLSCLLPTLLPRGFRLYLLLSMAVSMMVVWYGQWGSAMLITRWYWKGAVSVAGQLAILRLLAAHQKVQRRLTLQRLTPERFRLNLLC